MIVNRQRSIRVPIRDLEEFLARAMKELGLPSDAAAVSLVSSAQIRKWNAKYRGKDKPTDVLSFPTTHSVIKRNKTNRSRTSGAPKKSRKPARNALSSTYFAADPSSTSYLGDIAIAPAVAKRNAALYGRTFDQEMRILFLHGILHLMGYDHETDNGQMERRERRLRRSLGLEGDAA